MFRHRKRGAWSACSRRLTGRRRDGLGHRHRRHRFFGARLFLANQLIKFLAFEHFARKQLGGHLFQLIAARVQDFLRLGATAVEEFFDGGFDELATFEVRLELAVGNGARGQLAEKLLPAPGRQQHDAHAAQPPADLRVEFAGQF